jgi:hypothetical protein
MLNLNFPLHSFSYAKQRTILTFSFLESILEQSKYKRPLRFASFTVNVVSLLTIFI